MADNTNSSVMNKLDYLETTKTQIREALINKGQSVSTIDTFRSYVEAINDIQVGIDTSDADATAYDIIAPRTAYVKDKKLVGKINKITNEFSFDNYELSQTNIENNFIKDYTMKDNQVFHKEYLEGIDLIGKDFLIYMRPNTDESQAIVFTYNNTNILKVNIVNNTMVLKTYDVNNTETNTLTTYTDLFLSGTPTKTTGPYSGAYFGNDSYFTTKNIYDGNNILFEASENQSYNYFTINQSFDETKAVSSEANNKINLKQKDLAEIAGLRSEILKKDETIMGITGNLESGVKLFETYNEMQNDTTAQEGDLAVIYRNEVQPINEDSEFDSCIFPNTVVLDEAFSDDIYIRFRSTGSDYFDGNVKLSSSRFRFDGWGNQMIRVQYTSEDGITYTRTDGGEELVEFGTTIKWEDYGDPFNAVIGNFMKIGGTYFEGLYEYIETSTEYIASKLKDIDFETPGTYKNLYYYRKIIIPQDKVILKKEIIDNVLLQCAQYVLDDNSYTHYSSNMGWISVFLYDQHLTNPTQPYLLTLIFGNSTLGRGMITRAQILYDNNQNVYLKGEDPNNNDDGSLNYYQFALYDDENYSAGDFITKNIQLSPTSTAFNNDYYYIGDLQSNIAGGEAEGSKWGSIITSNRYSDEENIHYEPNYENYRYQYILVNSQLTLSSSNELLPGKIAYGKNGIIEGDASLYDNLPKEALWHMLGITEDDVIEADDLQYRRYVASSNGLVDIYSNKLYGASYSTNNNKLSSLLFTKKLTTGSYSNLNNMVKAKATFFNNKIYRVDKSQMIEISYVNNEFSFASYNISINGPSNGGVMGITAYNNELYIIGYNNNIAYGYIYDTNNHTTTLKWQSDITSYIDITSCILLYDDTNGDCYLTQSNKIGKLNIVNGNYTTVISNSGSDASFRCGTIYGNSPYIIVRKPSDSNKLVIYKRSDYSIIYQDTNRIDQYMQFTAYSLGGKTYIITRYSDDSNRCIIINENNDTYTIDKIKRTWNFSTQRNFTANIIQNPIDSKEWLICQNEGIDSISSLVSFNATNITNIGWLTSSGNSYGAFFIDSLNHKILLVNQYNTYAYDYRLLDIVPFKDLDVPLLINVPNSSYDNLNFYTTNNFSFN